MGHKVLLADDSITVQKIVKLSLTEEGIEVIALGNGEQAVQQLESLQPDLVMADVFMPGKDGYEVCEFVKSHPQFKHTPVILLVHAFEPFDPERAKKVGADQQLTKPFQSIRTLVTTVSDLLAAPTTAPANSKPAAVNVSAPQEVVAPLTAAPSPLTPPEEEFAVVSSLTAPPPATPQLEAAWSGGASVELAPIPAFGSFEPPLSEPQLTASRMDFSLPEEMTSPVLSALPQTDWQPANVASSVASSAIFPEADELPSFSLTSPPSLASEVTDDVLELSDVLSAPPMNAPSLGLSPSVSLMGEVPLLAVLPSTLPNHSLTEEVQPPAVVTEGASLAQSVDVGVGQLNLQDLHAPTPPPAMPPQVNNAMPAPVITAPVGMEISEAMIEEIVNRVMQRLSTQAVQEIAWEVVPEMAELLIRKQLSQQQQRTH